MKPTFYLSALLATACVSNGAGSYINYLIETDVTSGIQLNAGSSAVADYGTKDADAPVPETGVTYELITKLTTSPYTEYPLDSKTVGSYFPAATLSITTEDPYTVIPRTRADRPITVNVTVSGLLSGEADPVASKSVNFLHHIQSYGDGGTGVGINQDNATLLTTESITGNGDKSFTYSVTSIPSTSLDKTRGEERFSVYSLEHVAETVGASAPASLLASKYVQIWPIAQGSITGVTNGQKIMYKMPQVTLTYKDLYPSSTTYLQVYHLDTPGASEYPVVVPGSAKTFAETVPQDATLTLTNWDNVFDKDGWWRLQIVTVTPFGTEYVGDPVDINADLTIEVKGNITTSN